MTGKYAAALSDALFRVFIVSILTRKIYGAEKKTS